MTPRLLVLDLDGTVLGHDLVISDAVRDAIGSAQASGVIVTLATGRNFSSAVEFARDLDIDAPIICYQDALIRDPVTGQTLNETHLPGQAGMDLGGGIAMGNAPQAVLTVADAVAPSIAKDGVARAIEIYLLNAK